MPGTLCRSIRWLRYTNYWTECFPVALVFERYAEFLPSLNIDRVTKRRNIATKVSLYCGEKATRINQQ